MKHEISDLQTKNALADALKRLLRKKKFAQITIAEVAREAGVNRKTFYYHFRSTGALLAWLFEYEAFDVIAHFDVVADYEGALNFVMDYLEKNAKMIQAIAGSIAEGEVRKFLYADLYGVVRKAFDELAPRQDEQNDAGFVDFMATFYTEAISGLLLAWANGDLHYSRTQIIQYFSVLIRSRAVV